MNEDLELTVNDLVPRMRSDLRVHRTAEAGRQFEIEAPGAAQRTPLQGFELSISRMLNGQRTVGQVLAACGTLGIPVSLPSFGSFLQKLRSHGLLEGSGTPVAGGSSQGVNGTTWDARGKWSEEARLCFQRALKAYRGNQFGEAKRHLQSLLALEPHTAEALEMLGVIDGVLAQEPNAKARVFTETYNAIERRWFEAQAAGPTSSAQEDVSGDGPARVAARLRGGRLGVGAGVVVGVLAVGLGVPLPYSPKARCALEARASVEVKVARGGVIAENLVPDGKWVEKGAVLARFDGSELKKKLEANAAQRAGSKGQGSKSAKARQAKADAEVKKAQAKVEQLLARAKKKRTPAVVKAELKLSKLKAAALRAAREAQALAGAPNEADLAKLVMEKKALEAELALLDLVAPAAGFLAGSAKARQALAAGTTFGRLEDTQVMKAVAFFPELDLELIKVNGPMSVALLGKQGQSLAAKVSFVGVAPEDASSRRRLVVVHANLDNPDGALVPGAAGTATLHGVSRSVLARLF